MSQPSVRLFYIEEICRFEGIFLIRSAPRHRHVQLRRHPVLFRPRLRPLPTTVNVRHSKVWTTRTPNWWNSWK
jgi:hypothetical protein